METTTAIIAALERAPSVVVPLVREVPSVLLKRRPAPSKWSAHEHACHLAVVHRLFFDRLEQVLVTPVPIITPYERLRRLSAIDWNRTAEHGEYSHYSVLIMFRHLALHDFFHAYRIEELLLKREWTPEWRAAAGHHV